MVRRTNIYAENPTDRNFKDQNFHDETADRLQLVTPDYQMVHFHCQPYPKSQHYYTVHLLSVCSAID